MYSIPANAEGQPVPRSRNKDGTSSSNNAGSGAQARKGGVAGANPSGQAPAVGGANGAASGAERPAGTNQTSSSLNENDTFNKHYNKELRVSKDEIPIVLAELNDSAYRFIKRE